MNVGIFLGYGPQVIFRNEGLGRYLGGLIKGFSEANVSTTIVAPAWMKDNLYDFFHEIKIDESYIKIVTTKSEPVVWKLYKWLVINNKKKRFKIFAILKKYFGHAVIEFTKSSTRNFYAYLPIYMILLILGVFAAIPFGVIGGLGLLINKLFEKITKRTGKLTKEKLNEDRDALFIDVFYAMTEIVIEQLVDIVNKDKICDVWYVPSLFWPQVKNIKKPTIINAPDLVSAVYPLEFSDVLGATKPTAEVKRTVEDGRYFITYCEFIRQTLLMRDYGKDPANVIAIPHVNNSSSPFININVSRARELNDTRRLDIELSRKLLNKMISRSCPYYYAERINFDNVHYIFYASQIRPHKNMVTLLKAYEYLLRERNIPIKLVLTGWVVPLSDSPTSKYVYDHNLEKDVLAFSGVSATTLAALYKCADLVVNPSMYEGGFAFTFGEGMSVGTPSLIANTPFEMDVLGPAGLEDITFDPTSWEDLAKKIEYWLPKKEELYSKELPLYNELAKRTPDVVAREYIETFKYFIDKYQKDNDMIKKVD